MSGTKMEILWSPHHDDRFVTSGTNLSLYKLETIKDGAVKPQMVKVSDDTYASLLSTNSDHEFMKCLAWYPKPSPDTLLAVGLANGKVLLTSFGKGIGTDLHDVVGKEFVPRHARLCYDLAWNPVETNLIAEGLDRHKADYSVVIWDIHCTAEHLFSHDKRTNMASHESTAITKPFRELGQSETTFSLAWFNNQPKTLITGMNNKFLRIYDLRDTTRPQSIAYTKAVHGIVVDPHYDHRIASFYESHVCIWDTRNIEKPVLSLTENKLINKIGWAPTRCNLIGVLPRDSSVVKLYDIVHTSVGTDDLEPAVTERLIQPSPQQLISSFDWHPRVQNHMLTVSNSGAINNVKIFERIALSWSPDIYLSWACGRQVRQCHSIKLAQSANTDISILMKRRAHRGYGLQTDDLHKNSALAGDSPKLQSLWNWLGFVQAQQQPTEDAIAKVTKQTNNQGGSTPSTPIPNKWSPRFPGVKGVLEAEGTSNNQSDLDFLQWQGLDGQRSKAQKKIYRSEERSRALQLCGWGFGRDKFSLHEALDRLEGEGQFERAAAIAIFNLHMRRGIQAINRGAVTRSADLRVVAMALAGFTDEKSSLWKDTCASISPTLSHPYLQAMFAFLTCEGESYEEVLDSNMEVIDKAAFACMYLSDGKLTDYLEKLSTRLIEHGDLDGILLTGVTREGIDLMERYVDKTTDIQTAALIMLHGMLPAETTYMDGTKDDRVHKWIDCYRDLLNTWKLWHKRAEFDVFRFGCQRRARPKEQVYVSCSFCGKSVAYSMLASRNRHFMFGATTAHKPKITSCPGCRKPMPRCALCLINMGTAAGTGKHKPQGVEEADRLSEFSNWFTWCQTCRHGGHSHHMAAWFSEHSECPVTGCVCTCVTLDPISSVMSNEDCVTHSTV